MNIKVRLSLITALLLLAFINQSCTDVISSESGQGAPKAAPDFQLNDLGGNTVRLSSFLNNSNVLLAFGATWCPHCINEIPELKDIYASYEGKDLKLLYIDIQESLQKVGSFAEKNHIPYTVLLDTTGDVAGIFNVRGIPHMVLIGKNGYILYEGPRPREGLGHLLETLIADN